MHNYALIKQVLLSIFSVDVGLDESAASAAFNRWISDPLQRLKLADELLYLLQDSEVSLVQLLDNEQYVVYPADNEQQARDFILTTLWQPLID